MSNKHLIDILYEHVKRDYADKGFSFDTVWKVLVKDAKLSVDEQKEEVGNLYTDILQDKRFIYDGNQKWRLREYLTQDEIQLLQRKLYDFQQDEFIGNVSDDIDDLIDEDENFDEEQKEVEESIKSTVSEKSMNDEEE